MAGIAPIRTVDKPQSRGRDGKPACRMARFERNAFELKLEFNFKREATDVHEPSHRVIGAPVSTPLFIDVVQP